MQPTFFASPVELQQWFEKNHASETELFLGFYKKGSGKPSVTWPEAVDEALCVGWIDGVRKGIDDETYMIRFTLRKSKSIWSAVNIGRVKVLTDEGRMQPAGLKAFEHRTEAKSGIYSHEQTEAVELTAAETEQFKANEKAWEFFQAQTGSYRKAALWWVVSSKKDETRVKRISVLIDDSVNEKLVPQFGPRKRKA